MAKDVLRTVLDYRIQEREPIPMPSSIDSKWRAIQLPHSVNAKLAIYEIMREQKISEAIMCSRLHCDLSHICRLMDLYHDTDMNAVESALSVLGKQLNLSIVDAA